MSPSTAPACALLTTACVAPALISMQATVAAAATLPATLLALTTADATSASQTQQPPSSQQQQRFHQNLHFWLQQLQQLPAYYTQHSVDHDRITRLIQQGNTQLVRAVLSSEIDKVVGQCKSAFNSIVKRASRDNDSSDDVSVTATYSSQHPLYECIQQYHHTTLYQLCNFMITTALLQHHTATASGSSSPLSLTTQHYDLLTVQERTTALRLLIQKLHRLNATFMIACIENVSCHDCKAEHIAGVQLKFVGSTCSHTLCSKCIVSTEGEIKPYTLQCKACNINGVEDLTMVNITTGVENLLKVKNEAASAGTDLASSIPQPFTNYAPQPSVSSASPTAVLQSHADQYSTQSIATDGQSAYRSGGSETDEGDADEYTGLQPIAGSPSSHNDTTGGPTPAVILGKNGKPKPASKGNGFSCHQCKTKKTASQLLFCTYCTGKGDTLRQCRKKFCESCLGWYAVQMKDITPEVRARWKCPSCLFFCTCASCQRKKKKLTSQNDAAPASAHSASASTPSKDAAPASKRQKKAPKSSTRALSASVAETHQQHQYGSISNLPSINSLPIPARPVAVNNLMNQPFAAKSIADAVSAAGSSSSSTRAASQPTTNVANQNDPALAIIAAQYHALQQQYAAAAAAQYPVNTTANSYGATYPSLASLDAGSLASQLYPQSSSQHLPALPTASTDHSLLNGYTTAQMQQLLAAHQQQQQQYNPAIASAKPYANETMTYENLLRLQQQQHLQSTASQQSSHQSPYGSYMPYNN